MSTNFDMSNFDMSNYDGVSNGHSNFKETSTLTKHPNKLDAIRNPDLIGGRLIYKLSQQLELGGFLLAAAFSLGIIMPIVEPFESLHCHTLSSRRSYESHISSKYCAWKSVEVELQQAHRNLRSH